MRGARRRAPRGVLALTACALLAAGCGEDEAASPERTPVPPIGTATEPPPVPGSAEVPEVVGLRLDEAMRRLDERELRYQALSDTEAVQGGADWEVCRVSPSAGIEVPRAARLELLVARPGRCEELVPDLAR
jgi:hypothetical protein